MFLYKEQQKKTKSRWQAADLYLNHVALSTEVIHLECAAHNYIK